MFSNIGEYESCGIFTIEHFILIAITITGILIALKYSITKDKEEIHKIIKYITVIAYILEIIKIIYNINQNSFSAVNTYVPLYYCSILLYAGALSSFGTGNLKKGRRCIFSNRLNNRWNNISYIPIYIITYISCLSFFKYT